MGIKLYPPIIENKIPAFAIEDTEITIPFQMNRAVGLVDVSKIAYKFSTLTSNSVVIENADAKIETDGNNYYAKITISDTASFIANQYYKIQIAYVHTDDTIGYYSDTGVIKCINKPTIIITDLKESGNNQIRTQFIGQYTNDGKEKVYSYRFSLLNNGKEVATSGECLHNSTLDTEIETSNDSWYCNYEIQGAAELTYSITTINGYKATSPIYTLIDSLGDNCVIKADMVSLSANSDEGIISVSVLKPNIPISGNFILSRKKAGETNWDELYRFKLIEQNDYRIIYEDYLIEQGVAYDYSIQQFDYKGVTSKREIIATSIIADFEDAFLYDGQRQLKIRFNPKISSFKDVILESKIDTLGSKYPFFFKNGTVKYKEFPISGLISMWSDVDHRFMQQVQDLTNLSIEEIDYAPTSWLTSETIRQERNFKLTVLNWLNNGQPKLFRAPGEGNYIVRLMNVSLTPTDTLGRMLHTFNATAYEIADNTVEELKRYNILSNEIITLADVISNKATFIKINDNQYIARLNTDNYYNILNFKINNPATAQLNYIVKNTDGSETTKTCSGILANVLYEFNNEQNKENIIYLLATNAAWEGKEVIFDYTLKAQTNTTLPTIGAGQLDLDDNYYVQPKYMKIYCLDLAPKVLPANEEESIEENPEDTPVKPALDLMCIIDGQSFNVNRRMLIDEIKNPYPIRIGKDVQINKSAYLLK